MNLWMFISLFKMMTLAGIGGFAMTQSTQMPADRVGIFLIVLCFIEFAQLMRTVDVAQRGLER